MPTLNVNEIQAATDYYIHKEQPEDIFFTSNILLFQTLKLGKTYPGGKKIQANLEYGKSNSGSYGPRSELPVTKKEIITAAYWQYAAYYATLTIDMDDDLQNNGDVAIVNLLRTKLRNAEKSIRKTMASEIYDKRSSSLASSSDPNAMPFNGLGDLFDDTADFAYGEITPNQMDAEASVSGLWTPNKDTGPNTMSYSFMQKLRRSASVENGNDGKPNLYITTMTLQDAFERTLQTQARYSDQKLLDVGFDNLLFKGAPIVDDDTCNSGYIYGLNLNFIDVLTHVKRNFTRPEWKAPIRQPDTVTANIRWAGNLICTNRRAHILANNVSAS